MKKTVSLALLLSAVTLTHAKESINPVVNSEIKSRNNNCKPKTNSS